jgi:hypothetical protein
MKKTRYQCYKNDKKWLKNRISGTKKCAIRQKIVFFQNFLKNDGFSKFLAHISPTFDDSSDPPGQKNFGPARFSFVSFWWPRQLAIALLVASSSG